MRKIAPILIMFVLGLGLLSYPLVSSFISARQAAQVSADYGDAVQGFTEEQIQAEWDEAVKYNENLSGSPAHDPFIEGSGMAMTDNYDEMLDLTEVMATISIPKINVVLPVYHGTSSKVLESAIGHLEGSSLPVGGPSTHCILTGHTGLPKARLFTDLTELENGDRFYIRVLDKTLAYEVDQVKVVEPDDKSDLKRVVDQDYVTLLTCTPYSINSHRLLVRGHRVDYVDNEENAVVANRLQLTPLETVSVILAVLATVILAVQLIRRARTQKAARNAHRSGGGFSR